MVSAVNGASSVSSVSVYRKLNGHLNGRAATQVRQADACPDAEFRKMGKKAAALRATRQEKAQELYEKRTARYIPSNMAMEHAVQNRINNPKNRNQTLKMIDAARDLRSGIYAGPLPASAMAEKQRYDSMRVNNYM